MEVSEAWEQHAMRLGILGGTFDPVHYGHLLMAETCREQLQLDEVRLIPAGCPPHKTAQKITDGHARADMLQLAVSGYPEFRVDRRELRRQGPSFTVETLAELAAEFPEAKLFFIMGADSLKDVPAWREPQRIAQLATIVAVNRPGQPAVTAQQITDWVGPAMTESVRPVRMPGADLSSTELRQRVHAGKTSAS
ncbi:MAG: nicotinate-nucleotide adenylyltransferase [Planctomycetaceae bacterium]